MSQLPFCSVSYCATAEKTIPDRTILEADTACVAAKETKGITYMTNQIQTIRKRSGALEAFNPDKISRAISRAFLSTQETVTDGQLEAMTVWISGQLQEGSDVEQIQDRKSVV